MSIEAVIFDLDGTLIHFKLDYKTLRADVRSYLMRVGVPASLLNVNERIFEMLTKAEIFFKNNGKSASAYEAIRKEALAIAEKYEMEAAVTTGLQPGASETLKTLKAMGLKLGLCTTSSNKAAMYLLKRFDIEKFFDVIVCRDKVRFVKPNTEQFELALNALGVKAQATVVIGDSVIDMQSAKELKSIAVGIPTGLSTLEQLKQHSANYIVTSLTDLPTLVKELNKTDKSSP